MLPMAVVTVTELLFRVSDVLHLMPSQIMSKIPNSNDRFNT